MVRLVEGCRRWGPRRRLGVEVDHFGLRVFGSVGWDGEQATARWVQAGGVSEAGENKLSAHLPSLAEKELDKIHALEQASGLGPYLALSEQGARGLHLCLGSGSGLRRREPLPPLLLPPGCDHLAPIFQAALAGGDEPLPGVDSCRRFVDGRLRVAWVLGRMDDQEAREWNREGKRRLMPNSAE